MNVVIERDVSHAERHNGWVGDIYRSNHVGTVFIGNELDAEVRYVEAGEFI